ncbi:MAG TPA: phytanoyl-CoA dioxygenase family protein [Terriglobia bacterium]|nr:phytanoyl-CoA dioxygenase family protein [Terriglobia bacterium]
MLSSAPAAEFHQDGYCVVPSFLSQDEVAALLSEIETISTGATLASHNNERMEMEPHQPPDGTKVRRIYEPCTYYPAFRELSESKKLLDAVEAVLGPNLTFHYSKINMKPPSIGSVVEWHQDLAYYPLTNSDSLAVLFYLDAADSGNGCLQVIPAIAAVPCWTTRATGTSRGESPKPSIKRRPWLSRRRPVRPSLCTA